MRVLVSGSPDFRARRIMAGMNVDEQTALRTVERTDAERLDWYKRFYETGWLTPWSYDVCINTDHLNPEQAADRSKAATPAASSAMPSPSVAPPSTAPRMNHVAVDA